jgi:NADP-dependent 3-hydroxy acid dehydrogenase YdfG
MVQRVALVTGASSGIGRATTEFLAANGYYVFASALRMGRLEELRSNHIEPIELDVTDEVAIRASRPCHLEPWTH